MNPVAIPALLKAVMTPLEEKVVQKCLDDLSKQVKIPSCVFDTEYINNMHKALLNDTTQLKQSVNPNSSVDESITGPRVLPLAQLPPMFPANTNFSQPAPKQSKQFSASDLNLPQFQSPVTKPGSNPAQGIIQDFELP